MNSGEDEHNFLLCHATNPVQKATVCTHHQSENINTFKWGMKYGSLITFLKEDMQA